MQPEEILVQLCIYLLEVDLLLVLGVVWFGRHDGDYQPEVVRERMILNDLEMVSRRYYGRRFENDWGIAIVWR